MQWLVSRIVAVQGNDWQEEDFSWIETTYKFRENSYSTDLLIDFSIGTDIKNSSWRVIDIDQVCLLSFRLLLLIKLLILFFGITPVGF